MKKIARSLRQHRELIRNYFRAQKLLSSSVVEGLNYKAKVTMRNHTDSVPSASLNSPSITHLANHQARIHPRFFLTNRTKGRGLGGVVLWYGRPDNPFEGMLHVWSLRIGGSAR